jgi:glucose/arabinose dehydrogenase
MSLDGGTPELYAWGLRNPFGLTFDKQGKLFLTENGMDTRGSRPGYGNSDVLWEIQKGKWYGWPDFTEGRLLSDKDYKTPHDDPKLLLKAIPSQPPSPVALLGVNSSSNGLAFSPGASFGYNDQVFIAQFGDMSPEVGKIYGPIGFKVIRVDPKTGDIQDFAVNKGKRTAPATELKSKGLERPIDVGFDNNGNMYVVDFGIMPVSKKGAIPIKGTGGIWKISKLK